VALRSGRVCSFEPGVYEMLIRPGPRMGQAAGVIADCLGRLPAPPASPSPATAPVAAR
jgi:iron complex transport system substrate-binding protein